VGQREAQRLVVIGVDLDRDDQRAAVAGDADPQVSLGEPVGTRLVDRLDRVAARVDGGPGAHQRWRDLVDAIAQVIGIGEQLIVEVGHRRVGVDQIVAWRVCVRAARDERRDQLAGAQARRGARAEHLIDHRERCAARQ